MSSIAQEPIRSFDRHSQGQGRRQARGIHAPRQLGRSVRRRFNAALLEAVFVKDRAIVRAEFSEVFAPLFSRPSSNKTLLVEVGGVEPPSPGDLSGLLRAQPVGRSRLEAPTGGGPLGQPGCDVRRRPPGGAVAVSLLTTPILPSQATRRGRLPSYLGSERVFVIGACVCPGFYRGIRGPRPASPERFSLRSKPVHPRIRLSRQYTGGRIG